MFRKKPPTDRPFAPAKPSRDELIAQAKAHVRAARAEIGEETIAKLQAVLSAQEAARAAPPPARPHAPAAPDVSPAEQARKLIETMDKAKLADYLRLMARDKL